MARFSSFPFVIVLATALPLCSQQASTAQTSTARPDPAALLRVPPPPENASPEELEKQGDDLRTQKAYLDSIDYYRAAIKRTDTAALHNKTGISFFLLQRDHEARTEYERAIKLDKTYPEAHNNLGALFYNEKKYGPAIKEYKKAIKLNDENASFHKNLGTAYFSQRNFERASQEYQRAMSIDPSVFDRQPSGGSSINLISSNDLGHFHYVMAQMYGQHNDMEKCRYYLSKANEEGYPIKDALHDSVFAGLRKDPAFISFVRSLKPPSSDAN